MINKSIRPTIWSDLLDSFKSNAGGYCPKRVSGFVVLMMACALQPFFVTTENLIFVLPVDFGFVAACFKIATSSEETKLKLGYNGDNTPVEPTIKQTFTTSDTVKSDNSETTTTSKTESTNTPNQ